MSNNTNTVRLHRVMPAKERVKVLLEFRGQQTVVEVDARTVVREGGPREKLL